MSKIKIDKSTKSETVNEFHGLKEAMSVLRDEIPPKSLAKLDKLIDKIKKVIDEDGPLGDRTLILVEALTKLPTLQDTLKSLRKSMQGEEEKEALEIPDKPIRHGCEVRCKITGDIGHAIVHVTEPSGCVRWIVQMKKRDNIGNVLAFEIDELHLGYIGEGLNNLYIEPTDTPFDIGQWVIEPISGAQGAIVRRHHHLTGCYTYDVAPNVPADDGSFPKWIQLRHFVLQKFPSPVDVPAPEAAWPHPPRELTEAPVLPASAGPGCMMTQVSGYF